MPSELLIRPGHNDHVLVEDLLAPRGGRALGGRPPLSRIVLDAPLAASRRQFAEMAAAAGVPVVVDPLTFLLQSPTDPDNPWSSLPFASSEALTPTTLTDPARRRRLVRETVDFQLEHGATIVVPPYFAVPGPGDPWMDVTLACLADTAGYLRGTGVHLPVQPVLAGRLDRLSRPNALAVGIDRFAEAARSVGAQAVAMLLGPVGKPKDTYAKVLQLFVAGRRLRRPGLAVHAWRQGAYGPALLAAGLHGYECGITYGESTDLAATARSRRPPKPSLGGDPDGDKREGGGVGVYVPALGRSIPKSAVEILDAALPTRALLTCEDPVTCCPHGTSDALGAGRRAHAVRSRARYLAQLDQMPQASWRLHKVGQDAAKAAQTAETFNKVLVRGGLPPLTTTSYRSLAAVVEHLRTGKDAVA